MRNSNSIYIDDLLSISDFLEETQKDMPLINEDINAINKLVTILVDGGLIPKDEFDEFIKSDPITNVYNTIFNNIFSYELPNEFYKLVPRDTYIYTRNILKKKLEEILKERSRTIGF